LARDPAPTCRRTPWPCHPDASWARDRPAPAHLIFGYGSLDPSTGTLVDQLAVHLRQRELRAGFRSELYRADGSAKCAVDLAVRADAAGR
jgi:hypothetical protein